MKHLLLLIMMTGSLVSGNAQRSNFIISYPVGFPMGNLNDYIDKTSFRGVSLEFTKRQMPNLEVGIEAGWNLFYENVDSKVYSQGTESVTGKQFRYQNTVPILAGVKFLPGDVTKPVTTYLGLGIGTLYVNQLTEFGLYEITQEAWQFCLRPEAGIRINSPQGQAAFIGVKYYASFGTDDLDSQPYLTLNLGVVLPVGR